RDIDEAGLRAIGRRRPVLAAPQRRAEIDALADRRLVLGIDGELAGLWVERLPHIAVDEGPAGDEADLVGAALEHPEDRVAAGMYERLDGLVALLQVDQHR